MLTLKWTLAGVSLDNDTIVRLSIEYHSVRPCVSGVIFVAAAAVDTIVIMECAPLYVREGDTHSSRLEQIEYGAFSS